MPRLPWRRGRPDRPDRPDRPGPAPEPAGIWGRALATSESVQRRTVALGTPAGEVGALLSRAVEAGAAVELAVREQARDGTARWPDTDLQVPSDAAGRESHDRVRALVAAQRAALHRATLLTMPADAAEQAVLLAGLRRAVTDLEAAAVSPGGGTPRPDR